MNGSCVARSLVGARAALLALLLTLSAFSNDDAARAADAPVPLIAKDQPVDWWFVYKFNSATFPACGKELTDESAERECPFGGEPMGYANSQQFVVASSKKASFDKSDGCAGTSDPVAVTFEQIYRGKFRYLAWNDQFYGEPRMKGCGKTGNCTGSWGHSKGILAWNKDGDGLVIQVTTPAWPGFAARKFQREAGNTLGCIKKPNNIQNAQHFFALKLSKAGIVSVIEALKNASVVTDVAQLEIVDARGSPKEITDALEGLGTKSDSVEVKEFTLPGGPTLKSDVRLISKPSALHVPPWQMLSAKLGGIDLKAATWWSSPQIPTTTSTRRIACWDDSLGPPGAVAIAITGQWGEPGKEETIGLVGGQNHAKVGVSQSGEQSLSIFADLNQQGALNANCKSSQNGRGGLFYVVDNDDLFNDLTRLLTGKIASTRAPQKKVNVKDE
ncbi:deoxyribonuclease II family protein [Bradyrhizobium oligotrophicum]|uniref:deoxyribonuclease II family protein n=1 Tax=Bradyrhizobium oligotrophicum TaxID=44255 RepID=UPI003EB9E3C0